MLGSNWLIFFTNGKTLRLSPIDSKFYWKDLRKTLRLSPRDSVLFDMSDIGHSRALSKSQLFSFSAPSGVYLLLGVIDILYTEPRKEHFLSNIYQKRNLNKKNYKGNQNNNITFKPLLSFPFQYKAEKKLK